ncbi:MAG: hypothetical protein QOF16_282 [Actinomycetota bacterium]|nr:hypothetical protein [Actinomycetota bacterium]
MVKELPDWEPLFIEEAIRTAEERNDAEKKKHAAKRAVQLAREQAYHRLAAAIDRPAKPKAGAGQLSLFPTDPTLFD